MFRGIAAAIGIAAGAICFSAQPAMAQDVLSRDSVLRDAEVPVIGNPKGDITVVEYFDYQCPYCKKALTDLMDVAREDGKIRIVLKDWPILGKDSSYAARIALAAKYQGKYFEAHSALMGARGKLSEARAKEVLQAAGIDVAKADADLESNRASIEALLGRNNAQAEAFGFQGTPSFIVGTFRVPGVLDKELMKQAIKDARAAAKKSPN